MPELTKWPWLLALVLTCKSTWNIQHSLNAYSLIIFLALKYGCVSPYMLLPTAYKQLDGFYLELEMPSNCEEFM